MSASGSVVNLRETNLAGTRRSRWLWFGQRDARSLAYALADAVASSSSSSSSNFL